MKGNSWVFYDGDSCCKINMGNCVMFQELGWSLTPWFANALIAIRIQSNRRMDGWGYDWQSMTGGSLEITSFLARRKNKISTNRVDFSEALPSTNARSRWMFMWKMASLWDKARTTKSWFIQANISLVALPIWPTLGCSPSKGKHLKMIKKRS